MHQNPPIIKVRFQESVSPVKHDRRNGEAEFDGSSGSLDYREYVGTSERYDVGGALQFNLLTTLGLREHHYLLDIGCGSLRAGRLFIPYLLDRRYHGIEPQEWLLEQGIKNEVGQDLIAIKRPAFHDNANFDLTVFDVQFDFVLAHSIFPHAPQHMIRACLASAKRVLNQEGMFIATILRGNRNYEGDDWVYPELVTYSLEHIVKLGQEAGFVCTSVGWPHHQGQAWIAFLHPENSRLASSETTPGGAGPQSLSP